MNGAGGQRPVVGVCAALEHARWSYWELPADLLPRMYVDAVQRAGGAALLLPVDAGWAEDPNAVLDLLDGLVLAGGADIDPASYGAARDPETGESVPERDACEIVLARAALARDLPLLGICRGMQLLNVACGGTLVQHVPAAYPGEHLRTRGSFEGADHQVRLVEGSLAARAAGGAELTVKSHHHQAIDRLGEGLAITARSSVDDLPEAIEVAGRRFALGVQWHPEADPADPVIPAFLAAIAN